MPEAPDEREMKLMPPMAYFITFRTYGTWLQGDDRGSVTRKRNTPGTPLHDGDGRWRYQMKVALQHAPTVLDDRSRFIVRKTILDACSYRKWLLHEINVRSNHVHIVVSADAAPERVMNDFKAYATRRLREADAVPPDCRLWSRHGSTRYLWDERAVARACAYVRDGQSSDVLGED